MQWSRRLNPMSMVTFDEYQGAVLHVQVDSDIRNRISYELDLISLFPEYFAEGLVLRLPDE